MTWINKTCIRGECTNKSVTCQMQGWRRARLVGRDEERRREDGWEKEGGAKGRQNKELSSVRWQHTLILLILIIYQPDSVPRPLCAQLVWLTNKTHTHTCAHSSSTLNLTHLHMLILVSHILSKCEYMLLFYHLRFTEFPAWCLRSFRGNNFLQKHKINLLIFQL